MLHHKLFLATVPLLLSGAFPPALINALLVLVAGLGFRDAMRAIKANYSKTSISILAAINITMMSIVAYKDGDIFALLNDTRYIWLGLLIVASFQKIYGTNFKNQFLRFFWFGLAINFISLVIITGHKFTGLDFTLYLREILGFEVIDRFTLAGKFPQTAIAFLAFTALVSLPSNGGINMILKGTICAFIVFHGVFYLGSRSLIVLIIMGVVLKICLGQLKKNEIPINRVVFFALFIFTFWFFDIFTKIWNRHLVDLWSWTFMDIENLSHSLHDRLMVWTLLPQLSSNDLIFGIGYSPSRMLEFLQYWHSQGAVSDWFLKWRSLHSDVITTIVVGGLLLFGQWICILIVSIRVFFSDRQCSSFNLFAFYLMLMMLVFSIGNNFIFEFREGAFFTVALIGMMILRKSPA